MTPAEVYSCMVVHAEKVREEVKEHLFHIYCKCPQRQVGPDETSGRCDGPRGMRQPRIFWGTECNTVFLGHRVKGWGKGSEERREARLWGTRMPRKVLRLHSPCPWWSIPGGFVGIDSQTCIFKGGSVPSVENKLSRGGGGQWDQMSIYCNRPDEKPQRFAVDWYQRGQRGSQLKRRDGSW